MIRSGNEACKHIHKIFKWKTKNGKYVYICRTCGKIVKDVPKTSLIQNISDEAMKTSLSNLCKFSGTKLDLDVGKQYRYLPKNEYKLAKNKNREKDPNDGVEDRKTIITC